MPKGDVSGSRPRNPRVYSAPDNAYGSYNPSAQQRRNSDIAAARNRPFEAMNNAFDARMKHQKELDAASRRSFFKRGTQ